jgi:hypothetical protein
MTKTDPFDALGLPADPQLTDEQVRAAWREIAAATHPDRADGGDLARYTRASAAYAELRTGWGRSEAYADLLDARGPATEPIPAGGPFLQPPPRLPGYLPLSQLPARIWHGHKLRLLARAVATALLSLAVLALIPGPGVQPAVPAVITGLITWFALTSRADLAPPPATGREAPGWRPPGRGRRGPEKPPG